jgi:hypothetical protein
MKLVLALITLSLFACGDGDTCGPHSKDYTHSVLYCDGRVQNIVVECDPFEEIERQACVPDEQVWAGTDNCQEVSEVTSVCCINYVCRRD